MEEVGHRAHMRTCTAQGHRQQCGEGWGAGWGWGGDDKGGIETSVIVSTIKKNNFNEYIMIQLEDK